ncbi:MAG TPA: TonB family protein [Thiobacillus sp.]
MTHAERSRLWREWAPLLISLALHVVLLLLIAPWLYLRTIPAQQMEIEVMLEPDGSQPASNRPEQMSRLRAPEQLPNLLTKPTILPMPPRPVRPVPSAAPTAPRPPQSARPSAQAGRSGRAAPAPREAAALSAPSATRPAVAPSNVGPTALARGPSPSAAAPGVPSQRAATQPSSSVAASSSRPGEDRNAGLVTLDGPTAQVRAAQPELRQAARLGGQARVRGGSQAPDEGEARPTGRPEQSALVAARDEPLSQSGSTASRSGTAPQVTVPAAHLSGQGGVAAAETVASGWVQSTAPASGANVAAASRTPATSGSTASAAAASQSRSQRPAERGSSLLAAAATTGMGADVAVASRVPASSGASRTASDAGPVGRAVSPGERGSGLVAAAAPGLSTPGAVSNGAGPATSEAGESRAPSPGGGSSAARDAAAAMLAASSGGTPVAPSGSDPGAGQLSVAGTEASVPATRETRTAPMPKQTPNGQARVIEERLTASALQADTPRSIGEMPLLLAGFDRKPLPRGLGSINVTATRLPGEIPPSHHPGNDAPRYPMQALGSRVEGRVLVRAEIRADGQIGKLWIKQGSGSQVLDLAALDTVRAWRFTPAQYHGMAVPMWLDVPIEYTLPKE